MCSTGLSAFLSGLCDRELPRFDAELLQHFLSGLCDRERKATARPCAGAFLSGLCDRELCQRLAGS